MRVRLECEADQLRILGNCMSFAAAVANNDQADVAEFTAWLLTEMQKPEKIASMNSLADEIERVLQEAGVSTIHQEREAGLLPPKPGIQS